MSRPPSRIPVLCLLLMLHFAAAPTACANICDGPHLHDLRVRSDGALQVSGIAGHVALSRDDGRHWIDLSAESARDEKPHPFWGTSFDGPQGVRYQNLEVNSSIDVVISSRDGGATWEQVPIGRRAVLLQDDVQGVWWIESNDFHARYDGSVGPFRLHGVPRNTERLEGGASPTLIEFDGHRLVTRGLIHNSPGDPLPPAFPWVGDGYVTGFAVDSRGTIWLSSADDIVRGPDGGAHWERVLVPVAADWTRCNASSEPPPPLPPSEGR